MDRVGGSSRHLQLDTAWVAAPPSAHLSPYLAAKLCGQSHRSAQLALSHAPQRDIGGWCALSSQPTTYMSAPAWHNRRALGCRSGIHPEEED